MGQLNYSSSNSFLDGLSRHRKALGKPSAAPQWGAWKEVGMASDMTEAQRMRFELSPMPPFSNAEGIRGLEMFAQSECGLRLRIQIQCAIDVPDNPG